MLSWPRPGISPRLFLVAVMVGCPAGLSFPAPETGSVPASPFPLEIEKARVAIADLRVYLDFDDDPATFASWPLDMYGKRLPPDQIARAARLALALWTSVLPDMRFRLVQKESEANLSIRFGKYLRSGFANAGGRSFLPAHWSRLDGDCGRRRENRRPDGSACQEWEHNIIVMQEQCWAVRRADFRGNRQVYGYFAWIFDPARPHYLKEGRCVTGSDPAFPWSDSCVPFAESPYFDSIAGADLAAVLEHEFGHTLLGEHTPSPYECVDYARRPILSKDSCVRLTEGSYSTLFPGNGVDGYWNRRGIFAFDAVRLKRKGYRVSYPRANATLVLARPDGAAFRTVDWGEAQRAMIWPLRAGVLSAAQTARQWFLVDVESK